MSRNDDAISRQAAIDAILAVTGNSSVRELYEHVQEHGLSDMWSGGVNAAIDIIIAVPSAQRWIPCSEKLPDNRVSVIVCYREWQQYAKRYAYTIVVGWYAREHSVKENVFSEWEDDCDYNEEDDEYYIREGWYEFTTQGNSDLFSWYINAEVIAWMPLPEPPEGE